MGNESILIIFVLMSCAFGIIFGGSLISGDLITKEPMQDNGRWVLGLVLIVISSISTIGIAYEMIRKPEGKECDKCEGTGRLPGEKCKTCGHDLNG